MKLESIELARGASLAYRGYLITRMPYSDGYHVVKDGFVISRPQTLAEAKKDVEVLTS